MAKDYYEILGVEKNASAEEIKKAFHKLAHKHHPHKGGDEKKFKEINEAYQVLSSKERRDQYDQFGNAETGGNGPFGGQWAWGNAQQSGADFDFGDLGDFMEGIFGFGSSGQKEKDAKKGRDIEVDLEIELEDILKGAEKQFFLNKLSSCQRCQGSGAEPGTKTKECFSCRGTGQVQQIRKTFLGSFTQRTICPECGGEGYKPEKPCIVCKGEGRLKSAEDIKVFVPKGVDNHQIIKLSGRGEAGRKKGKAGDLYVRIFVKPHKIFKRKGDNLYISASIPFSLAVLGGEVEIPILGEKSVMLKIPSGIESGKILKVSNKGIPRFSGSGRGDLYVELKIETPKKISKEQKELLEKLKKEGL